MNNYPLIGVGTVVIHNDRVLLVRRSKPPYSGLWTIPGGKVHWGETLQQAAERELLEETGIIARAGEVIYVFDVIDGNSANPDFHYVVIDLVADYVSGEPVAKDDAEQAAWFSRTDLEQKDIQATTKTLLLKIWE